MAITRFSKPKSTRNITGAGLALKTSGGDPGGQRASGGGEGKVVKKKKLSVREKRSLVRGALGGGLKQTTLTQKAQKLCETEGRRNGNQNENPQSGKKRNDMWGG